MMFLTGATIKKLCETELRDAQEQPLENSELYWVSSRGICKVD